MIIYEELEYEKLDRHRFRINRFQEGFASFTAIRTELYETALIRERHLLKLYYYRGETHYWEYFRGWVVFAMRGLESVPKLRSTGKFPDYFKLYDVLWLVWEDSFDVHHRSAVSDLNKYDEECEVFQKIAKPEIEEVRQFVGDYYKWASEIVSQTGGLELEATVNKIKELLHLT